MTFTLVALVLIGCAWWAIARANRSRTDVIDAYRRGAMETLDSLRGELERAAPRRLPARARAPWLKRSLPDVTRREGYWRSPPATLSNDATLRRALAAAGPQIQVCFTGWSDAEKLALATTAHAAGFRVMSGASVHLTMLCVGETPGPVKLQKAAVAGAAIVSGAQFEKIAAYDWPPLSG